MRWTAQHQKEAVERSGMRGLRLRAWVETGNGSGLVLSTRDDSPGVLGLGAVDTSGDAAALGLDVEEVTELRDLLSAWLEEQ